jgi:hypothetical protein
MDPNQPGGNYPVYPGQSPSGGASPYPQPRRKKKKHLGMMLGVVGGGLALLAILVAVVLFAGNQKKPTTPSPSSSTSTTQHEGPQPATAVDTEQTNNAISQDLSTANDDKDLPANELDDKKIGF